MPTTDSSTMTVTRRGDREIVITRELDAPRELVFKTITDPKLISKWWGPRRYTTSVDKMDVRPGGEGTILQEVLDLYKDDGGQLKLEPRERLAKSYSCKAAIKAGDPLTDAEMSALLDQLFETDVPFVCPHGRPVAVKLSLDELDKRFGRTS